MSIFYDIIRIEKTKEATMKDQTILIIICVGLFLGLLVSLFFEIKKRRAEKKARKEFVAKPCYREAGLDLQMGKHFPRKEGEKDWEYVKRIFPEIHKNDPMWAICILFGKSITQIRGANRDLAMDFLTSKPKPSPFEAKNFAKGFFDDPAYD